MAKWTSDTIIIKKVLRRGHTGLAVYESWSTNYISRLFTSLGNLYVADPIWHFR